MRAPDFGHGPGLAAPEAASSRGTDGAASVASDAVAPAGLTAQKESAQAAQAAQSREQSEPQSSAISNGADKAFLTLRAMLALKGYGLHRTAADFYVTRWGMAHELRDLAAVARFVDQVGAAHA